MKLKKLIILFSCLTTLLSSTAFAAWTGQQSLYRLYAAGTYFFVQTAPSKAHINPDGCSSKSNYILNENNKFFDEQIKMLLTASAAGKKVSLDIKGCVGSYPSIDKVIIY